MTSFKIKMRSRPNPSTPFPFTLGLWQVGLDGVWSQAAHDVRSRARLAAPGDQQNFQMPSVFPVMSSVAQIRSRLSHH